MESVERMVHLRRVGVRCQHVCMSSTRVTYYLLESQVVYYLDDPQVVGRETFFYLQRVCGGKF